MPSRVSLSEREPVMEKIDLFRQIIDRGFNQGDLASPMSYALRRSRSMNIFAAHLRGAEF
jgi:hypothetical protein